MDIRKSGCEVNAMIILSPMDNRILQQNMFEIPDIYGDSLHSVQSASILDC